MATASTGPQIIGWAHSPFGRLEAPDAESLIAMVAPQAIADAGLEPQDIDEIVVTTFNGGFLRQEFPGALVAQVIPQLRHTPATRVENACATGSAGIYAAMGGIEAGRTRTTLVVGLEKMTSVPTAQAGEILLSACYRPEEADVPAGFAGVFGTIAAQYFDRYGDQSEALARIAAKNHHNGMANPNAQLHRDFGFDFCNTVSDKNPYVAAPLRRTDCSLISDGAAAVVIAAPEVAQRARRRVGFRGRAHVNDFLPISRRDILAFDGARLAWQQAQEQAGVTNADLDLAEVHDCFTIAELLEYEAFGLAEPGKGAQVVAEGRTERGGDLPVNLSGGLKAKGHPIGATGVSMHAIMAMQLTGEAGEMQLPGASLGAVFNMGGSAVANYVSILEAV